MARAVDAAPEDEAQRRLQVVIATESRRESERVSERLILTDVFLIASGTNERQVSAIVDAVEEAMHAAGQGSVRREGVSTARWVLLDYGEIVVHVQHAEDRVFYALERLWRDCPVIELPADIYGIESAVEQA